MISENLAEKYQGILTPPANELLGCVIGESGDTYTIKLAPSQHVVVVTGPGSKVERQEWHYTFEQVQESHASLLFLKVGDLLRRKGLMA